MPRLLFLGDIAGNIACDAVCRHIGAIKRAGEIDFIVANVENVTGGLGISRKDFAKLRQSCIDCFTTGNHSFHRKEDSAVYDEFPNLLRPGNYPRHLPGAGLWRGEIAGRPICVLNLMGQRYMEPVLDNPFAEMKNILSRYNLRESFIFLDFHACFTEEKLAMGHYAGGRISAMAGTHTHVQTNDARLIRGTGYVSDAGMCGDETGIAGMEPEEPVFRYCYPGLANGPISGMRNPQCIALNGALYDLNPQTHLCDRVSLFKQRIEL